MSVPIAQLDVKAMVEVVGAVGALGSAASGLVDTTKIFWGGVSRCGYSTIRRQLQPFHALLHAIPHDVAWRTLYALWINGAPIERQKATAKRLIRLGFNPHTAPALAAATGLPQDELAALAQQIDGGADFDDCTRGIRFRLDAVLDAVLDAAYEKADQKYRNAAKLLAATIAIALSAFAGWALFYNEYTWGEFLFSVAVGALATPLAPVAKDLTTAITAAVQASAKVRGLLVK